MTGTEVVVTAQGLGKAYRLYPRAEDRLKQLVFGKRRRLYEEFWAVRNVTLQLRRGEALGVIGENGAGKSTLLRLLCGTTRPTTGTAEIEGRVAALLELGTGFNPLFTGRENVWLSASVLGLTKGQIKSRFDAIADFAGIGEFMELPVRLYSSGMKARLAFAVSAHVDADLMIVDEILAVGDAAFAQKCLRYLDRFRARGTLLFVSHNTGTVAKLCENALWLECGEVREFGPAGEVCANYLTYLAERSEAKVSSERNAPAAKWKVSPSPPLVRDRRKRTRNRIEVSGFNPDAPWHGHGGALIENAYFCGADGRPVTQLEGGDEMELHISCRAYRDLPAPIVGFMLRDKHGQNLFGDSTYLACRDASPSVAAGAAFTAGFRFQLPYLARGDYSLTLAITEGTQDDHIHVHWIEEAVILTVRTSPVRRGIFGNPARDIHMEVGSAAV
jgi:lipopolysaccharide transport system ATP-binding protein